MAGSGVSFIANVKAGHSDKEAEYKLVFEFAPADAMKAAAISRMTQVPVEVGVKLAESTSKEIMFTGSVLSGAFNEEGVWKVTFLIPEKYYDEASRIAHMTSVALDVTAKIAEMT